MRLVLFGSLLFVLACTAKAGGDRRYHELGLTIAREVQQRLVDEKVCGSVADCGRASTVLFVSSAKGLHFQIYGVVDPRAVGRISEVLLRRAKELPEGARMHAEFLEMSKADDLQRPLLSRRKAFAEINVRGQYAAP
jgi:hypothetical protein